ncbi:MAG: CDP-glycerol glycerophosphotransferase family protein [Candidatus Magasanikbacteria bacterium]|nr:CDP-glycerol glycerophosphotransferase family protein [Candidatus Magasanikbacteria bacterium]
MPLYLVGLLVKKNNKIWIFGTGNGTKYNDNSRALFEYVNVNEKIIRPIWLTKSDYIVQKLRKENFEVYKFYSVNGIYYSIVAKVLVLTTSFFDVNSTSYLFSSKSKIIQLWHGTPLKRLTLDASIATYLFQLKNKIIQAWYGKTSEELLKVSSFNKRIISWIILQYIGRESDLIISATDKNKKIYAELPIFGHKNIKTTGQPRNDVLFEKIESKNKKKLLFYLPTWREYDKNFDFFGQYKFNLEKFDSFLERNNANFIIKLHACDEKQSKKIADLFANAKNISLSQIEDIYEILPKTDILLTDYSSVYFDFLLLNRPVVFTPFDLVLYEKLRGFYYDYNSVTPGPKANDWDEVVEYVQDILNGVDNYKQRRLLVNRDFNRYQDGKSSERVFQEIIKTIS